MERKVDEDKSVKKHQCEEKKGPVSERKCNFQQREENKEIGGKKASEKSVRHSGRVEEEMESERGSSQVWHSHHLQQGQVSSAHIVKVDLDILPPDLGKVLVNECFALCPVVNHIHGKVLLRRLIEAVAVLARKQVDAHDTENQPKDEANQQHIHNGGDGTHQGVDYHLDQTKGERKIWQSEDQEAERNTANLKPKTLHTVMALHLAVFCLVFFFFILFLSTIGRLLRLPLLSSSYGEKR